MREFRVTTRMEDRKVLTLAVWHQSIEARAIKVAIQHTSHNALIHFHTIQNKLRDTGLHSCKSAIKPMLKDRQIRARLVWVRHHVRSTRQQCRNVLFKEESGACLHQADGTSMFGLA